MMRGSMIVVVAAALTGCATTAADVEGAAELRHALLRQHVAARAWPEVFAVTQEILARTPDDLSALAWRGVAYGELGMLAEGQADLERVVAERDEDAWAHAALALIYERQRVVERAEAEHRRAIELASNEPLYRNNLGFSLYVRGKTEEAIEQYREALRLDPMSARVRNNLGFAYARKGDLTAAAAEFARGGTPAEAKNNLGFAYEMLGNLAQALIMYREAVQLEPGLQKAQGNLEHVARRLGRELPQGAGQDSTVGPDGVGSGE